MWTGEEGEDTAGDARTAKESRLRLQSELETRGPHAVWPGRSWQTLVKLVVETYTIATCATNVQRKRPLPVTARACRLSAKAPTAAGLAKVLYVMLATTLQLQDLGLNFTRQCMHPSHHSRSLSSFHGHPPCTKFTIRSPRPSSSFSFSSCLRHMSGSHLPSPSPPTPPQDVLCTGGRAHRYEQRVARPQLTRHHVTNRHRRLWSAPRGNPPITVV